MGVDVEMNVYVCGYVFVYVDVDVYKHSEEFPLQTESDAIRSQSRSDWSKQDPACQISHRHKKNVGQQTLDIRRGR